MDFVSCVDLARLHGESASRCPFAQSALHLEYVERRALPLVSGPVDRRAAPVVAGTMRVLAEELFALTAGGVEKPAAAFAETPGSGGIWTDDMWVSLCEGGLRWALATGDVITTACLIDFAHSLGIAGKVAPLSAALDYLLDSQEPDGSLGAADPRALNPRREGVLASMLAFSVGLEQDVP